MTAAQGLYAEGLAVVATDTNWVVVATIPAASFTAGATYLILGNAFASMPSSTNEVRMLLTHGMGPTAFTDAAQAAEQTSTVQQHVFSWMYVFTQPGTAEDVQMWASSSSTTDVTAQLGQIFALKLGDVGAQNTDWYYTEDTVDYTTTASKVSKASVTFTPNGTDDWLIVGYANQTVGSTSANYRADINDSVAGILDQLDIEGEDLATEFRGYVLMRVVTPTAVSHTFSIRFSHETTAGVIQFNNIFALNLNKFAQHAFSFDAASIQPAASPSWTTTRTIGPTPGTTGDWLIWGHYQNDCNVLADNLQTRLQIDAAGGGLASNPNYGDTAPGQDGWDPTDVLPFHIFKMLSLSTGAGRTANLDVNLTAGTTLRVLNRTLLGFSMELGVATYTEAGGGVAVHVASGDDTMAMGEAASGVGVGVASGADTTAVSAAGEAVSILVASGDAVHVATEAGDGVSILTASGAESTAMADAGEGVTILTASGADTTAVSEAGEGVSVLTASGADTAAATEAGEAAAILTASGAESVVFTDAGDGVMGLIASGDDTFSGTTTYTDAGQGDTILVGSGADTLAASETGQGTTLEAGSGDDAHLMDDFGTGVLGTVGGGLDTFSGATIYTEAGQGTLAAAGSGADAIAFDEAGGAVSLGAGSGADTQFMLDAGTGVLIPVGGGLDIGGVPITHACAVLTRHEKPRASITPAPRHAALTRQAKPGASITQQTKWIATLTQRPC